MTPVPKLVARASTGAPAADPTAEIWTLFAVAAFATMLRMYSRISLVGFRDLRADDFLACLAIVCMIRIAVDGDPNCDRYCTLYSQLWDMKLAIFPMGWPTTA